MKLFVSVVSVAVRPFFAVLIITIDSNLRVINCKVVCRNQRVFGLCRHGEMIAAVGCDYNTAGTITLIDPRTDSVVDSFRARPALDRRHQEGKTAPGADAWGHVHGIKSFLSGFTIVNTIADSLVVVKADNSYSYSVNLFKFCRDLGVRGAIYGRHSLDSNYYHFNSVLLDRDSPAFYVLGHNTKSPDRSFVVKGRREAGDNTTGGLPRLVPDTIWRNLGTDSSPNSGKQCHDLLKSRGLIYYSESANSAISVLDENGKASQVVKDRKFGYVRGLDVCGSILFAGSSNFRTAATRFLDDSLVVHDASHAPAVLCIDAETRDLRSVIELRSLCGGLDCEIRDIVATV